MKKRANQIEMEKRVFTIQGWIIEGVQDHLICKNAVDKWGFSLRQAQRLVSKAYNEWKKLPDVDIEQKRLLKIALLKQSKRTLKDEYKGTPAGLKVLLDYEKEIIKLEGLELPKKHIHEGNPEKPLEMMVKREVIIQEYNGQ